MRLAERRKYRLAGRFLSYRTPVRMKPLQQSIHLGVEHRSDIEGYDLAKDQPAHHA